MISRIYKSGNLGRVYRGLRLPIMIAFCCLLLNSWLVVAEAKASADVADASFLNIATDARGAAMAGAQGAATQDVYAMYWNPAGLSKVLFNELGVTYQRIFQDMSYSFIGYAKPTESYGTLAGQLFFFSSGKIPATSENPDGSFGGTGDSFTVADLGLGVSQSKAITNSLSYGVSLKLLSHKISDQTALALAVDLGMIYETLIDELRIGVSVHNFSTSYKFLSYRMHEPWGIRLSGLYTLPNLPLFIVSDYNLVPGQPDTLNVGLENWFFDLVAIRVGMKALGPGSFLTRFSMGLGFNLRDLYQFDYALCPHSELGVCQRFSVIVRF